ncbi:hypothetical protein KPH14_002684 [Odynerus spinipes]|uniref:Uncharacterized protein n=1 Tax=Odynerus spinipes TaxID=1348599 RepID=A0AAD9VIT0_9HYME|nr:hypothetical protein KPH14_002684 [Odynerus spinipes]
MYPSKEQAIVTDASDGLTIKDYTIAIGKIVGPKNIRFVSRISNGRVYLYLSSKNLVDRVMSVNSTINIGWSHNLRLKPLVSKDVRIIISNVCPVIPHSIIEEKLHELGINISSLLDM